MCHCMLKSSQTILSIFVFFLPGKASSGQQTERTILIKGSAEATRQANNWIQQIISSPDKDMADILGKSFTVQTSASKTVASVSTIQSTVIVNRLVLPKGPSIKYVSILEGGGVSEMMTLADMGGGGLFEMLTSATILLDYGNL